MLKDEVAPLASQVEEEVQSAWRNRWNEILGPSAVPFDPARKASILVLQSCPGVFMCKNFISEMHSNFDAGEFDSREIV